jgi:hypothetical protein
MLGEVALQPDPHRAHVELFLVALGIELPPVELHAAAKIDVDVFAQHQRRPVVPHQPAAILRERRCGERGQRRDGKEKGSLHAVLSPGRRAAAAPAFRLNC